MAFICDSDHPPPPMPSWATAVNYVTPSAGEGAAVSLVPHANPDELGTQREPRTVPKGRLDSQDAILGFLMSSPRGYMPVNELPWTPLTVPALLRRPLLLRWSLLLWWSILVRRLPDLRCRPVLWRPVLWSRSGLRRSLNRWPLLWRPLRGRLGRRKPIRRPPGLVCGRSVLRRTVPRRPRLHRLDRRPPSVGRRTITRLIDGPVIPRLVYPGRLYPGRLTG